jgi:hypothetical protein
VRSLLAPRTWAAFGVLALAALAILGVRATTLGGADVGAGSDRRDVELVAVVAEVRFADGFAIVDGRTASSASFALDDGRRVEVFAGTRGEVSCTRPVDPNACVLLADVLGSAVVWFALVDVDPDTPSSALRLPGLVDMLAGGDLGVLPNGWVVRLTTGVVRTCDTETVSLRDFINSFPADAAVTVLDLYADEVVEVVCR